jgi:hypothetical protein
MLATARPSNSGNAGSGAARGAAIAAVEALRADYPRWAARCYHILDKHDNLVPFAIRPAQHRVGDVEREELARHGMARLYLLKGRQGGFTTDQQARSLHTIWSHPGAKCLSLADTREKADAIFEITTRAIEHFPLELLPRLGPAETREISFPGLDTKLATGTAGATGTGRGLTLKRLHGSEFAFWKEPKRTLNAVSPALERPGTTIALETTASGYGSEAHDFWNDAYAGKNGYRALFFPWWECDWAIYRTPLLDDDELGTLEDDEQLLVTQHGLTLEHIKWRRLKIGEKGRAEFLQEYAEDPESCWISPGGTFYDVELLKLLMQRAPAPVSTDLGGALELYTDAPPTNERGSGPKPERVIIGCDVAEGIGGDRSAWVARAFPSGRLVAKYEDSKVAPEELAGILNAWGRRFGTALLVVEKNAHGITVLRKLRDVHQYPITHLYHRAPLDKDHEQKSERIGWATTGESKPVMLDAGRDLLKAAGEGLVGVPSLAAIRDGFGIRRNDKGQVDTNGRDVFVAECLAWLGRSYSIGGFFLGRA